MIDDKKKSGEWKIQLVLKINFISSKNFNETRDMHSKSDNYEIMIGADTIEIIRNLFNSTLKKISRRVRRINERKWFCIQSCWINAL